MKRPLLVVALLLISAQALADEAPAPAALFARHCAQCHGVDRLGIMGPALFPENLERLRKPEAIRTITEGRIATQMPPFGTVLKPEEISAIAEWI